MPEAGRGLTRKDTPSCGWTFHQPLLSDSTSAMPETERANPSRSTVLSILFPSRLASPNQTIGGVLLGAAPAGGHSQVPMSSGASWA